MTPLSPTRRTPRCGWCTPPAPAEVLIVWQHPAEDDCWCTSIPGNERRHVSHACAEHADRERRDLAGLGFTVLPWVPTERQTGSLA